jgi:hypothetical protein
MVRLQHISFFFAAFVLFFGITETAISADSKYDVENISETSHQSSFVFPQTRPNLFGIHRQGRSAVNLLRILPAPNAKNNEQIIAKPNFFSEIQIRRAVTVYLYYSRDLDQSLTIRELLFPFHYFL